MATNKNQHFVPRCYLRSFTRDEAGRAINLFNIDRQLFIRNAPVKHQCSGDYFYGEDPRLEKALQFVEREYARVVFELLANPRKLTDHHQIVLKRFWLLQYLRTEAASRRMVEMVAGMGEYVASEGAQFRISIREAVRTAMMTFAENMHIIDDLNVCILRNKARRPFVTSDDPAILTNRWHSQDKQASVLSFGMQSAGALLFLPISPRLMCLGYDADVYSIKNSNGFVDVRIDWDVKVINEHQFLNCLANIFVQSEEDAPFVSKCYCEAADRRPETRQNYNYAILDESSHPIGGGKQYIAVDPAEAGSHREAIIHVQAVYPQPSAWPKLLRWRVHGKVFTNGTGVGFVRRAQADSNLGFLKEPTRRG